MVIEIIDTGEYLLSNGIVYRHSHEVEYELMYFRGDGRVFANGDLAHDQLKNRVFLSCPGQEHELRFPDGIVETNSLPLEFKWITFNLADQSLIDGLRAAFHLGYIEVSANFSRTLSELYYKFLSTNPILHQSMEHQFLSVLYELIAVGPDLSVEEENDERIALAIRFMVAHLHDNLDLAELAKHLNLHKNYLFLFFRQRTGMTPMQLYTDLKLKDAARMLLSTDWKLNYISNLLKFYDVSHFSKLFKQKFGTSPLHFRKNNIPLHLLGRKRESSDESAEAQNT